jgi:hypothetical protein
MSLFDALTVRFSHTSHQMIDNPEFGCENMNMDARDAPQGRVGYTIVHLNPLPLYRFLSSVISNLQENGCFCCR